MIKVAEHMPTRQDRARSQTSNLSESQPIVVPVTMAVALARVSASEDCVVLRPSEDAKAINGEQISDTWSVECVQVNVLGNHVIGMKWPRLSKVFMLTKNQRFLLKSHWRADALRGAGPCTRVSGSRAFMRGRTGSRQMSMAIEKPLVVFITP